MLQLLNALYGDRAGYVEIRSPGKMQPLFFPWPDGKNDLEDAVRRIVATHDVYFGVLLRVRQSGKAEDTEQWVHWLWADVDKKAGATFADLLRAPIPQPQIVVDSGRGWHLYWRMARPLSHNKAQDAMTAIASQLGGDMVGDPARILRLPGTLNLKDSPLPVRILRFKDIDRGWRLGDFDLTVVPTDRRRIGAVTGTKGTRSEDLFKVAIDGIRGGLDDDEIYDEMLARPEGSKLTEMSRARADRWVALTIKKARRAVEAS